MQYLKQAQPSTGTQKQDVSEVVRGVIDDVRTNGDAAVRRYSKQFDKWSPEDFKMSQSDIDAAISRVPDDVLDVIREAQTRVRRFAEHQLASMLPVEVETEPGVFLGHKHVPIGAVGAYVPGGRYPLLASAHMTVLTAKAAGVKKVTACTPPIRGVIPDASVAAMHMAGADSIYLLGGVQAVAAMSLGTESMGKVDMIAGPGNAFVAEAKRQLFGEVGIDLLAGPTEILVIADEHADPFVVAVDLLSQVEHGPDSPGVLITTSEALGRRVIEIIAELLPTMPTRDFAEPAWRDHGEVIVVADLAEAYRVGDDLASEHVEILTSDPREALSAMTNYGALFLGERTCVSYGDKIIGTNHTLPTRKSARYGGGLWVGKFLKTVTYQEVKEDSISAHLGSLCGRASRAENFEGHARSGDVRAAKFGGAPLPWAPAAYQYN